MRHADAGYDLAVECAVEQGLGTDEDLRRRRGRLI